MESGGILKKNRRCPYYSLSLKSAIDFNFLCKPFFKLSLLLTGKEIISILAGCEKCDGFHVFFSKSILSLQEFKVIHFIQSIARTKLFLYLYLEFWKRDSNHREKQESFTEDTKVWHWLFSVVLSLCTLWLPFLTLVFMCPHVSSFNGTGSTEDTWTTLEVQNRWAERVIEWQANRKWNLL